MEAVEAFVVDHYSDQIRHLTAGGSDATRAAPACPGLVALLQHCCADEAAHRADAADRLSAASVGAPPPPAARLWAWVVGAGSRAAVAVARVV